MTPCLSHIRHECQMAEGPAAGGGFALAAACDLRVASTTASFFAANVRIGVSGGEMGLSWLLPQTLGRARATELLDSAIAVDVVATAWLGQPPPVLVENNLWKSS